MNFLLLNAVLLLPIRHSAAVGVVALLSIAYALYVAGKLIRQDNSLATPEGRFALTTLFIPAGIILFRSMYFYQIDSLLLAMTAIALFLVLRHASLLPDRSDRVALLLEVLSLPLALIAAWAMTDALFSVVSFEFRAPVFASTFGILALDIARRTHSRRFRKFTMFTVSILTSVSFIFAASIGSNLLASLLCLPVGAAMALFGHINGDRTAIVAGCLTAAAGVFFGFDDLVQMILKSSWIDLAIFGASAIALGSVLDRHGARLKYRFVEWVKAREQKRKQGVLA